MAASTPPPPPDPSESPKPAEPPSQGTILADRAQSTYVWWKQLSTINAEDPLWLGLVKIGVRALGVLVLLALSPLILLGFLFAFLAVS